MNLLKRITATAAGVTLMSTAWATRRLTRKGVRSPVDPSFFFSPFELDIPFESVSFFNPEGQRLRGWWLDTPHVRKVVVLCSGYGRSKSDLLGLGARLWKMGYSALLFDFRDQGESDPAVATIGHYERDDLFAALDYVQWRVPGSDVALVGCSMGAAAAIMAAAERTEVRAVIADSSFADLGRVLKSGYRQLTHLPATPAVQISEFLVWLLAGYKFSRLRPVEYVGAISPRALFLIHGDADRVTSVRDAFELYDAAGEPKQLWICEGAGHCGSYFHDRKAYVDRVTQFVQKYFGLPEGATIRAVEPSQPVARPWPQAASG
jgi:fermentation-respiration switch protein FrsA (DUF1100 family)